MQGVYRTIDIQRHRNLEDRTLVSDTLASLTPVIITLCSTTETELQNTNLAATRAEI